MATVFMRDPADVYRRIDTAITELDRLDAGQGPTLPGHSIRDRAHDLRALRDELRELYGEEAPCAVCDGNGDLDVGSYHGPIQCRTCHGTGRVPTLREGC